MNNKLFKTAVVLVTIVGMLCSFASAATINSLNYDVAEQKISMNVTFAEDATRGAYIAYAAKSVEAGTEGAEEIDNNYYVLGPIIAIFQPEGSFLTLGNHGEPINPALIPEGYDYIVLKAGDNGAASTLADAFAAEIPKPATKYTITFVNYDGTKLYEVEVEEGVAPEYVGETPVKAADAQYTYAFAGWDKEIVAATENATYTAEFEATPIVPDVETFTVTFMSEGAEHAKVEEVAAGTALSTLVPAEPTKPKNTFIGWYLDDAFTAKMADNTVNADTTLYAKFSFTGIYGDANGDGSVKATDIVQLKRYLKNTAAYTGKANTAIADCLTAKGLPALYGDANGDGSVKATDIVQLKRYLKNTAAYTGLAGTQMVMVKD